MLSLCTTPCYAAKEGILSNTLVTISQQLHGSFFAANYPLMTATSSGFRLCLRNSSSSSSSSSSRLKAVMGPALQSSTGTYMRCSPLGSICRHEKLLFFGSEKNFISVGGPANGFRSASILHPLLKSGFSNSVARMNVLVNRSPFGSLGERYFSRASSLALSKSDIEGGTDGGNVVKSSSFSKYWKNPKGKRNSKSRVSAVNEAGTSILRDQPVEVEPKKVNSGDSQLSKGKGKTKQMPKSKKNQEKSPVISSSSEGAAPRRGSRKAKKSETAKTELLPLASETSSNVNAPTNVTDSSAVECQGKGRANKSRKGKSTKQANAKQANTSVNADKELEISTITPLPQKQKLHMSIKTKPMRQLYPPTGKSVLVVESAAKAKVIQGYLGDMFEVLPSYGHVRDLAARSGSVRPDDDFSMVWEVPSSSWTHLKSIKVALTETENLILASDPDREGEAIAWHIIEMLHQQNALREDINVARVVFNEITESSVKSALQSPRDIDVNLVNAYLARRALDYLIGFNISPLLWRKLPGCQSAGRVQSAALSLICDRETEIDEFTPQEYWTVEAEFKEKKDPPMNKFSCPSYLTHLGSKKLQHLSITSSKEAIDIEQMINSSKFEVVGSIKKSYRKSAPTPYITSTLQQDAANKLYFSSFYTMKIAQKLYEGVMLSDGKSAGLITYMRTDGLHMSDDAVKDIRSLIVERYGQNFTPESGRKFFKKVKNAQEAHEAIRPTDIRRLPSKLVGMLDEDCLKLYTLIWSRAVACQMEPAIIEQIQVDIGNSGGSLIFRSASSRVDFLGYRAVYKDVEVTAIRNDEDEDEHDEVFEVLNGLTSGDPLDFGKVELKQHQTQPPPRYSEASLVKKMEELGIGRPSTYASTIKVLKDRKYVTVKSRILQPEFRGRMLSAFLSNHFSEVSDYSFTADMETELDNVSAGMTEWKGLLRDYWTRFSDYCKRASNVHIHQVEKMLEKTFGGFLFASLPDNSRTCPSCGEGTLIFKVSRFGAGYFIGCDQHPKCKYIAKTLYGEDDEDASTETNRNVEEPKVLGINPGSDEKILLKDGPYGHYVQLGEDRKGYLPKRASISTISDVKSITLEDAIQLLRYPITLGTHPDDGQPVLLKLAKHGFSIKHRRANAPVPKNVDPSGITLEKALKLLSGKAVKRCGRPKKNKEKEAIEMV